MFSKAICGPTRPFYTETVTQYFIKSAEDLEFNPFTNNLLTFTCISMAFRTSENPFHSIFMNELPTFITALIANRKTNRDASMDFNGFKYMVCYL